MPLTLRRGDVFPPRQHVASVSAKHLQVRVKAIPSLGNKRTRTTSRFSVKAVDTVLDYVQVPVDYYRLLQVPRASSRDSVRKAYDALMKQPPHVAYSADVLFSR